LIVPLEPPKQDTFDTTDDEFKIGGCVMVKFCVAVHPLASVTVTVYVPADKPEAVAAVPPDGDHE